MADPSRFSSSPLARHNAPFTVLIILAGTALTWFTLTQSVFGRSTADPDVAAAVTTRAPALQPTLSEGEPADEITTTSATAPAVAVLPLKGLSTEVLLEGLAQPAFATSAPGDDRIYIIERSGRVLIFDPATGTLNPDPYLDVAHKTNANTGIELGLLGLAFHPDFVENGRLFIYYTDKSDNTAVAEYARLDSDTVDPTSERIFISVARRGVRHNAGMLQFGPDGYLYIAIGDGGLFEEFGQDPNQFLGTILRLDMNSGDPYAVPDDNPFFTGGGAPEVWAYGLRNPWRFAIDRASNTIFIGDVGQADAEEINAVALEPVGYNFGWPVMEGFACWLPRDGCDTTGKVLPVTAYAHDDGCSVTGGYVYRGSQIPEFYGHYFYADWCLGWVRSFEFTDGGILNPRDWTEDMGSLGQVTSFGLDPDGELIYTTFEGVLGRIIPER